MTIQRCGAEAETDCSKARLLDERQSRSAGGRRAARLAARHIPDRNGRNCTRHVRHLVARQILACAVPQDAGDDAFLVRRHVEHLELRATPDKQRVQPVLTLQAA